MACTTYVYDTYYLRHWNEENERTKTSNLTVEYFSSTFVNLSLACFTSMYDFRIRGNF